MSAGGIAGGAVAVAVAAKRKRIYSQFRQSEAITVSTAKTLKELGISESQMFRMLVRRGEIVKVDGDRYYLDETEVQAGRGKRLLVIAAVVLIFMIAWLFAQVF